MREFTTAGGAKWGAPARPNRPEPARTHTWDEVNRKVLQKTAPSSLARGRVAAWQGGALVFLHGHLSGRLGSRVVPRPKKLQVHQGQARVQSGWELQPPFEEKGVGLVFHCEHFLHLGRDMTGMNQCAKMVGAWYCVKGCLCQLALVQLRRNGRYQLPLGR